VYTGQLSLGGNVVLVMSAGWRLHYYAHLDAIETKVGKWVSKSDLIGRVGATGNAAGKPAHLHYSIQNCLPYWWKMDTGVQGWKKMFYVNPIPLLNKATASKA
jgi:murein DD-endopeptidase MepM/ murein hydrolase activator NlpD